MHSVGQRALFGAWRLRQHPCRSAASILQLPGVLTDTGRRQRASYAAWTGSDGDRADGRGSGAARERRPRQTERGADFEGGGGAFGRGPRDGGPPSSSRGGGYGAPRDSARRGYGGAPRGGFGDSRRGGYGGGAPRGGYGDSPRGPRGRAADERPGEDDFSDDDAGGSGSERPTSRRVGGAAARWGDDDDGAGAFASARGGGGRGGYGADRDRRSGGYGGGYGRRDERGSRYGGGYGGGGRFRGRQDGDGDDDFEEDIRAPSPQSLLKGDAVFGVSPVYAAVFAGRRKLHTLYVQDSADMAKRKDEGAFRAAVDGAARAGIPVQEVEKHTLNMMTDNRTHQGLVLDADPLDFTDVKVLPAWDGAPGAAPPVWVALDEVTDPQNFGAVLRSALFLGAAGVVTCQRNSAPLSPVVSKASSGAMEVLPVYSAKNLPQLLAACSVNGWAVVGADADGEHGRPSVACSDFKVTRPTIVVFGSEGKGLRTNVRKVCTDGFVGVAGTGPGPAPLAGAPADETQREMLQRIKLDSLNVSVAAGIIIHSLLGSAQQQAAAKSG